MVQATTAADATNNGTRLRDALQVLEKALSTPAIEGELAEWGRALKTAWDEAAECVRASVDVAHRTQLKEIAETDPEMFKRIEEVNAEDDQIRSILHNLDNDIPAMIRAFPRAETDPAAGVNEEQKRLVDEGLAFVSRVRKQDVVVQTWIMEAFNRERGAGD